jgi:flagellar motor switch/type III secretory pathway protein FliN
MIVDQSEIEALLAQAQDLSEEVGLESAAPPPRPPRAERVTDASPEIMRLLRLKVPVIVQLAARRMNIAEVRKISLGMIIEFYKAVDDPLVLLINNHSVGRGEAVKVGEHFGLRVTDIGDAADRIKSMGA